MIEKVRASELARVMKCAGVLYFKDLPKPERHEVANEGIAASEVLDAMFRGEEIPKMSTVNTPITEDMVTDMTEVYNTVMASAEGNQVNSELKLNWHSSSGIRITGRYDISFLNGDTLYVDDLKYGYRLVEPEENWQLLIYAIGEVIRLQKAPKTVVLRIHQPRAYHPDGTTRSWTIDYETLMDYATRIEKRLHSIAQGENTLQTSEHCKYCAAAASCPAFNKAYWNGIDAIAQFQQDDISNSDLSKLLDMHDRFNEIAKIRKDSLEQLAASRMTEGQVVPGWDMKKRYSNRSWMKNITPDAIKLMTGIDISETKMISPNQAEKRGLSKDLVKQFTTRFLQGTKVERSNAAGEAAKVFGKGE